MQSRTLVALLVASGLWLQVSAAQAQDLTVSSLTAKVTGTTVLFDAKVCNTGASVLGDFDVDLYYDRAERARLRRARRRTGPPSRGWPRAPAPP